MINSITAKPSPRANTRASNNLPYTEAILRQRTASVTMDLLDQISLNTRPGPFFEDDSSIPLSPAASQVRLIAYYLPQFHAIAENDAWWGKGFTEWTNVTKAVPRFAGHYQPRLPGELGFYDLRSPDVLRRQAALARRYGIHGFCFHHYWFNGRRLLETPLQNLLAMPDLDMPFCINWANESWSRRWDGKDAQILMEQKHSIEDDHNFAASLEPLFADPRYIRIDGRPLLMLYRPAILPDALATVERWRQYFLQRGLEDPYIVMAQAFGDNDPRTYGMDAAAGFAPHNAGWDRPRLYSTLELLDPRYIGDVVRYADMARNAVENQPTDFTLFPSVVPCWDNEARKPGRGFCFLGSTPELYGTWLAAACLTALERPSADERIVFINAWNEWAEGAYLEPDRHFGYAFLAETARILNALADPAALRTRVESWKQSHQLVAKAPPKTLATRAVRKLRRKMADIAESAAKTLRS